MAQSAPVSCRLEAMQSPAAVVDPRLHVRAANSRFAARWAALGGDPAVLRGGSLAQLCPLAEQLRIRHELWRRTTGETLTHSLRLSNPPAIVDLTPIESNDEPHCWLATFHQGNRPEDLSMNRARIAALVHDLKMPLQAVLGWVSVLTRKPLAGEHLGDALRIIERNVRLEADMLAELLEVTSLTSSAPMRRSHAIDICQVVRSTVETLRPIAEEAGIALTAHLPPAVVTISGNAQDVARIMSSLLVNAIEFSDRGGTVECSVAQNDGWARLTVRDDGRGITAGFLPHVFDSFHRVERPEQPPADGSGLGLTVVRHLAHRHGGFVHAQSGGPGCGATFTVTLPVHHTLFDDHAGSERHGMLRGVHGFRTRTPPDFSGVHDRAR